ncbi:MAG: type II toxin-antitoxin system HicB family antitoxin [Candidatus Riflebacteria bacterium]|nr:type II toxin-antitoxin system HicB family antitoxin [Candidatus Riflebacteria bacterium]
MSETKSKLTMIYWKGERFWLGKLLEHPEIMSQGESIAELESNLREAFLLMAMEDVPEGFRVKKLAV